MPPPARELPHNLDAEKALIGGVLIDNSGYDAVARVVKPAHCFRDAHRKILTVMAHLSEQGKPIDLVSLKESLDTHALPNGETWLDDVGGPAYVASLVDGVPRSTNVKYYAEVVKEKAALRQLIFIANKMLDAAYANDADFVKIATETDARLMTLATEARVSVGAAPVNLSGLLADMDERVKHRGQITGMPTGLPELDLLTHGWQRGEMVVIAGQTSFGKSILALNTAMAIAATGERVVYYSFEMPRIQLERRLWCALAGVPLTRYTWGNFSESEYGKLAQAMERIPPTLMLNANGSRAFADVRAECRQIRAEHGLAAVVLDNFQHMEDVEGENRIQQLGAVSRKIQGLGLELGATMFPLSQLTLKEEDTKREPQLDDLRECKSLAHDANTVLMLHPHKPAEVRTEQPVVTFKLLCRKQRGGRLGKIWLDMERDYVRFVPAEEPRPEPKAVKEPKKPKGPESPTVW